MENIKHIPLAKLGYEIADIMQYAVSDDYAWALANNDEFMRLVRIDIEETSAWQDEGHYSVSDLRYAIGRTILALVEASERK